MGEKIKSKPNTRNFETKVQKEDQPFQINLWPVGDRTKVKQNTKVEDKFHQRDSELGSTDLHQIRNNNEKKDFVGVNKSQKEIHSLKKSERVLVLDKSYVTQGKKEN